MCIDAIESIGEATRANVLYISEELLRIMTVISSMASHTFRRYEVK